MMAAETLDPDGEKSLAGAIELHKEDHRQDINSSVVLVLYQL